MTRETVGKLSSDLIVKSSDNKHSAHDQMEEQLKDYEKNVDDAIRQGVKLFDGDFYVVVLTKKERLMENVIRNYFFPRSTCPTPEWDQAVYRYLRGSGTVQFLWVVPSKDTCEYMQRNALSIDKSERQLLDYVLSFYDNSLLRFAKRMNGELDDSPLLA